MKDYHNFLFPYAYNVLGSKADAKDAIQDVMARYLGKDREVNNEKSYLISAVINQSINIKNKNKRTISKEEVWLPEPVATASTDEDLMMEDVLSYSLLFLLEQLNPKERAVFILKEAFAYRHKEIAEVLSISVANSRKLLSRARTKVRKAEYHPDNQESASQLDQYINAIRSRDTETLQQLLSDDVTFYADGGEDMNVVKQICTGIDEVSELLIFAHHKFQRSYSVKHAEINYQPALLFYEDGKLKVCQVYQFDEDHQKIEQICNILDPEKLKDIK